MMLLNIYVWAEKSSNINFRFVKLEYCIMNHSHFQNHGKWETEKEKYKKHKCSWEKKGNPIFDAVETRLRSVEIEKEENYMRRRRTERGKNLLRILSGYGKRLLIAVIKQMLF
jgi:hypothetical protein